MHGTDHQKHVSLCRLVLSNLITTFDYNSFSMIIVKTNIKGLSYKPGTSLGTFRQIIGSLKTVPGRMTQCMSKIINNTSACDFLGFSRIIRQCYRNNEGKVQHNGIKVQVDPLHQCAVENKRRKERG